MARHDKWSVQMLREIHAGNRIGATTADSMCSLHASESGMITLVTVVTLLFFIILIAFLGNISVAVNDKIELQNAADAAAYSTSLWQARGMNAITTANHLMGEATAMAVIIESFGGKLLELKGTYVSDESKQLNSKMNAARKMAPVATFSGLSFMKADQELIDTVYKMLAKDRGKHGAGATIYDAKLTLKCEMEICLEIKDACNIVSTATKAIPFINAGVDVVATGIHAFVSTMGIAKIGMEWMILQVLQETAGVLTPFKSQIENVLIPALSLYGDTIASGVVGIAGNPKAITSHIQANYSAVNSAIEKTRTLMESETSRRQEIELATYPTVTKLRLPVTREAEPPRRNQAGKGRYQPVGPWEMPPSEWEGPFFTNKVWETIFDFRNVILKIVSTVRKVVDGILDVIGWVGGSDLAKAAKNVKEELAKLENTFVTRPPDARHGYPGNPSHTEDPKYRKYRLDAFYWQTERTSQWVRATYPYVDCYREPIISLFKKYLVLGSSNAATYYVHWTNRYTLNESHAIRSSGQGGTSNHLFPTAHMYVMRDMVPARKGHEPWTGKSRNARALAESYFAVTAFSYSAYRPAIFGPRIFENPNKDGTIAFAQALLYNANGRSVRGKPGTSVWQPNTGWDTLNWLPPVRAYEWGNHQPSCGGGNPGSVFVGKLSANENARVKLNWQAKLVPVSPVRLEETLVAHVLSEKADKALRKTQLFFRTMTKH